MTQSLLESHAVATLPPTTFKLLTVFALGARPPGLDRKRDKGSNGVQAVTAKYATRFGMDSRDTVYRGIETLIERGLIIRTRDGHRSKTHFALYAVAWLPVTHRDGQPLDTPEPPNDSWRTWRPATPKRKKKTPNRWVKSAELPSDDRTQSRPIVGHDESICRPTMSTRLPGSRPMVGNTLRNLGTGPRTDEAPGRKAGARVPQRPDQDKPISVGAEKVRQLLATNSAFTDGDLLKILKVTIVEVQEARGIHAS